MADCKCQALFLHRNMENTPRNCPHSLCRALSTSGTFAATKQTSGQEKHLQQDRGSVAFLLAVAHPSPGSSGPGPEALPALLSLVQGDWGLKKGMGNRNGSAEGQVLTEEPDH